MGKFIWCDIICFNDGRYQYVEGEIQQSYGKGNPKYNFGSYNIEKLINKIKDKYNVTENDFKLAMFDEYTVKDRRYKANYGLGIYVKSGGIKRWVLCEEDLD